MLSGEQEEESVFLFVGVFVFLLRHQLRCDAFPRWISEWSHRFSSICFLFCFFEYLKKSDDRRPFWGVDAADADVALATEEVEAVAEVLLLMPVTRDVSRGKVALTPALF